MRSEPKFQSSQSHNPFDQGLGCTHTPPEIPRGEGGGSSFISRTRDDSIASNCQSSFQQQYFIAVTFSAIQKKSVDGWWDHVGQPERSLQHGILEHSQHSSMDQGTAGFLYQQSCIPVSTDALEGSFHPSSHLPAKLCSVNHLWEPVSNWNTPSVFPLHPTVTQYPADIRRWEMFRQENCKES